MNLMSLITNEGSCMRYLYVLSKTELKDLRLDTWYLLFSMILLSKIYSTVSPLLVLLISTLGTLYPFTKLIVLSRY